MSKKSTDLLKIVSLLRCYFDTVVNEIKLQSTFRSIIFSKFVLGGQNIGFRMIFCPKRIIEKERKLPEK